MAVEKSIILLVNGKVGGGSPQAGVPYWNEPQAGFVPRALAHFPGAEVFYVAVDYQVLSSAAERVALGKQWAASHLPAASCYHLIGHSMGCAFAVGIAQHILSLGHRVGEMIHINAYQASDIEVLPGVERTVDYQYTNDRIIHLPVLGRKGEIQGAECIRRKSHLWIRRRHRGPIWPKFNEFWDDLEQKTQNE